MILIIFLADSVKTYGLHEEDRALRDIEAQTLSRVDEYNLRSVYLNNMEWLLAEEREQYKSKKPVLKSFYKSPANLYEVHVNDFDLVINPVIQYVISKEKDNDQSLFLNTRGLTLRGKIANKIGFAAYLTDNQERDELLVGAEFFDSGSVPEARYVATTFRALGGNRFVADGTLTLRGVSRPVPLEFTWTAGASPQLAGKATLSRLAFQVGTGDWSDTELLPDEVVVTTRLVLAPAG